MVKNPPANTGDTRDVGLIPELGRSPVVGNGNTLQYPCLEYSMGRERSLAGCSPWDCKRVRRDCELGSSDSMEGAGGDSLKQGTKPRTPDQ